MCKQLTVTSKKARHTCICALSVLVVIVYFMYSGGFLGNKWNIWSALLQRNKKFGSTWTIENGRNLESLNATTVNLENHSFVYSTSGVFETILKIKDRNCRDMEIRQGRGKNRTTWNCRSLAECNNGNERFKGRLPSGCDHRLPKAIIIGVDKAGKRELIDFLAMHPRIVIKRHPYYEISFFSSNRWKNGLDWYRKSMPLSFESQITMEKSPSYFVTKDTPQRLKYMNPNIKLILIVRNPVERTISRWTFNLHRSRKFTLETVREGIRALPEKLKTDIPNGLTVHNLHNISAIRGSVYDKPFENYLKHFNRSQIHIVDSEKLKHDPYSVLRSIENFLDLEHGINKKDFIYNGEKKFYCLRDPEFRNVSACFGDNRGRPKPNIQNLEAIKSELRRFFYPHNERFYNLSGINFHWE